MAFRRPVISVSALLSVLLVACGKPGSDNGSIVTMYDNQFSGAVLRVPVGARVTFLNVGRSVHNAVALDDSWKVADVPPESGAGGRGADRIFDRPGVYRYRCSY